MYLVDIRSYEVFQIQIFVDKLVNLLLQVCRVGSKARAGV